MTGAPFEAFYEVPRILHVGIDITVADQTHAVNLTQHQ